MKHIKIFFKSIKNNLIALFVFLLLWQFLSFLFEEYIIPKPISVFGEIDNLLNKNFFLSLQITLFRVLVGFLISFILGSFIGILAYIFKIKESLETTLILLQVLPGTILGIVFLLIFGQNSLVPICLIVALTTPMIAINTGNSLYNSSGGLKKVIVNLGGNSFDLIRDLYLPLMVPTFRNNFTVGLGFSLKIVILGEFIATDNGLGYLLNLSKIYFNMKSVFFYLFAIILLMLIFQIIINLVFVFFWEKYLFLSK